MPARSGSERWQRLGEMGRAELYHRLRQQVKARADALRYKAGLGFSVGMNQGGSPQALFFFTPQEIGELCVALKQRLPEQVEQIVQQADKVCRHRFDILGYEDLNYGNVIDWHCDPVHNRRAPRKPWYAIHYLDFAEVGDAKITWELNRHQHLVTLAKAYRLTGDERFVAELFRQWQHWHDENPYPIGVNWSSSLEVGMRSLSWLWLYFLLAGSSTVPDDFREQWLHSLGISARHIERNLSTYFSPNTHLLGESVALFFIGVLCPELAPAERWKKLGWELLRREAQRQVRSDGLHFEQSIYYHVYALDFFLHASVLAGANNLSIPKEFESTIEKMLDVLCLLGRAGAPPQLGDDDGGRVFDARRNRSQHLLDPLTTGAVLYGRSDFKFVAGGLREETIWLLGAQGIAEFDRIATTPVAAKSAALEASGLYLMAGASLREEVVIAAGSKTSAAGHRHADALSVTWRREGRPLLIDPGTLVYIGEGSERQQFRSTPAHNTLVVDGLDQLVSGGPFAWSGSLKVRAEGWVNGRSFDLFVGSQDGYRRLPSPVMHRRWVFSLKGRFWLVRDLALGEGNHRLDLFWHVSPELSPRVGKSGEFPDAAGRWGLRVIEVQGNSWSHKVEEGSWSSVYGRKHPAPVLHFSTDTVLPAEFVSLLDTADKSSPAGSLTRVEPFSDRASGFQYRKPAEDHSIYFGGPGSAWSLGPWSTDAEFIYWGGDAKNRVLVCCNAKQVAFHDRVLLESEKPLLRCEIFITGENVEVVSSDDSANLNQAALRALAEDLSLAVSGKPLSEAGH